MASPSAALTPASAQKKPALDTPPSSDIEPDHRLPPSSPQSPKKRQVRSVVDRVLGALRLRQAGRALQDEESSWKKFKLGAEEFKDLERRIYADERLRGWYEDKCRYDYDSTSSSYTLRMPTALHESFIAQVSDAIISALYCTADAIASKTPAQLTGTSPDLDFPLRSIEKGGSPTLELHPPKLENSSQESQDAADVVIRRSPDATFYARRQDQYPTVVLEVSYAQKRKDLRRIAESYIIDSQHAIRCVLGLDVEYQAKGSKKVDKTASISIWRAGIKKEENSDGEWEQIGICEEVCDGTPFRSADGEARPGRIMLYASDFLPAGEVSASDTTTITVPFAELCTCLATAEARHEAAVATAKPSSAPMKFRKRKRTPSEELSDSREDAFAKQEAEASRKELGLDGAWDGPGRRAVEVPEKRRSTRRKTSNKVNGG